MEAGAGAGRSSLKTTLRRFAWLAATGFLLHGNWEWLQTPFYDDRTASINLVVWYRLHCTLADVLILLGCVLAVSLFARGDAWLARPEPRHLVWLASLGVSYTAASEQVNVGLRGAWVYSELMLVIPGTAIGLVPLLQWALVPPATAWLASRLAR